MMTRRLTDEECRILIAVEEGRLFLNRHGRYEIDQEVRPDRRMRENLRKRGLLSNNYLKITAKGKGALETEMGHRAQERREKINDLANEAQRLGIY